MLKYSFIIFLIIMSLGVLDEVVTANDLKNVDELDGDLLKILEDEGIMVTSEDEDNELGKACYSGGGRSGGCSSSKCKIPS